ncbi:hypothetical protein Sm713_03070 [Streptomyces sp. TS71-3]|nr:hypothetical protein Sm713_03070 [Streptomyces sp. TS71-3]
MEGEGEGTAEHAQLRRSERHTAAGSVGRGHVVTIGANPTNLSYHAYPGVALRPVRGADTRRSVTRGVYVPRSCVRSPGIRCPGHDADPPGRSPSPWGGL